LTGSDEPIACRFQSPQSRPARRIHLTLSLVPGQSYRSPRSEDAVCSQGNAPSSERSHDRV